MWRPDGFAILPTRLASQLRPSCVLDGFIPSGRFHRVIQDGNCDPLLEYHGLLLFESIPSGKKSMTDLGAVLAMLKKERDKLNRAIASLSGTPGRGGRRKLSAEARERIAAAQRKRWAKFKAKKR